MGETLIESSHSNCMSIQLSPLSDGQKQQNKELIYDWPHTCKNISPACNKCHLDSYEIATTVVDDKCKLSPSNSDLSAVNNRWVNFSTKTGGYVYSRRKLQRNSSDLLSEGNATESSKPSFSLQSSISSEDHNLRLHKDECDITAVFRADMRDSFEDDLFDVQEHHLQPQEIDHKSQIIQNVASDPNYVPHNISGEGYKTCARSPATFCQEPELEHKSSGNNKCSSSKSNNGCDSDFRNNNTDDNGGCSSSGKIVEGQFGNFNSVEETCILFIKNHALVGGLCENSTCADETLGQESAKSSQLCKICGHIGSTLKMLICDLCEETFHISCCIPRVKLPFDDWYCQPCSKKVPKTLSGSEEESSRNGKRLSYCDRSLIQLMLTDHRPYTTGVRIGKDFQADVPEWMGPVHSDFDASKEVPKLDPVEYTSFSDWSFGKPRKSSSIGNWVQCREVIYGNDDDEGTLCGKWRRVPLFVVQTDDWDCSCVLPWDPLHADCAVPQELETEEVLRHLKYIELLTPRLANKKQKTG